MRYFYRAPGLVREYGRQTARRVIYERVMNQIFVWTRDPGLTFIESRASHRSCREYMRLACGSLVGYRENSGSIGSRFTSFDAFHRFHDRMQGRGVVRSSAEDLQVEAFVTQPSGRDDRGL